MKRYLKYKNFIPYEFVQIIDNKINTTSNKLISILLVLNMIVFPNSINKVLNKEDEQNKKQITDSETNLNTEYYISKENIKLWVNQINSNIINMQIQDNNGNIKIKDKEEVYKIEIKEELKIKSITKDEQNFFVLEVGL